MTTLERRKAILSAIKDGSVPISGSALAHTMGVSRQIIVQDIAVLRASNHAILATPSGYMMTPTSPDPFVRVLSCKHRDLDGMRCELLTVVQNKGVVQDVIIEHPIYGEFRAMLMLSTEDAVEAFVSKITEGSAMPLSTLTGGAHLHTIAAQTEAQLDAIEAALELLGVLIR